MKTLIWRHRRENLHKCSLQPLKGRSDIDFYSYPDQPLPDLTGYVLLKVGAPPLTAADRDRGLLILDATWNLAARMERQLSPFLEGRSLPEGYRTAYPRKQTGCPDSEAGLSSVEALYLAYLLMGRDPGGLLDSYYWRDLFLEKNNLLSN